MDGAYDIQQVGNQIIGNYLHAEIKPKVSLYEIAKEEGFYKENDAIIEWLTHSYVFSFLAAYESIWYGETFNFRAFNKQFGSYISGDEYAFTPSCWRDYMCGKCLLWDNMKKCFMADPLVAKIFREYLYLCQNNSDTIIKRKKLFDDSLNEIIEKHLLDLLHMVDDGLFNMQVAYDEVARERHLESMMRKFIKQE